MHSLWTYSVPVRMNLALEVKVASTGRVVGECNVRKMSVFSGMFLAWKYFEHGMWILKHLGDLGTFGSSAHICTIEALYLIRNSPDNVGCSCWVHDKSSSVALNGHQVHHVCLYVPTRTLLSDKYWHILVAPSSTQAPGTKYVSLSPYNIKGEPGAVDTTCPCGSTNQEKKDDTPRNVLNRSALNCTVVLYRGQWPCSDTPTPFGLRLPSCSRYSPICDGTTLSALLHQYF